jgi:hypothetical protein
LFAIQSFIKSLVKEKLQHSITKHTNKQSRANPATFLANRIDNCVFVVATFCSMADSYRKNCGWNARIGLDEMFSRAGGQGPWSKKPPGARSLIPVIQ